MELSRQAKTRISKLIEYMEKLDVRGHFTMKHWVAHQGKAATIRVHGITGGGKIDLLQCGMSACAVVWACTIPSFQKAGLMMKIGDGDDTNLRPVYECWQHFDAVKEFFDVTESRARQLFGPYKSVRTPKEWAKSARKLLEKWSN